MCEGRRSWPLLGPTWAALRIGRRAAFITLCVVTVAGTAETRGQVVNGSTASARQPTVVRGQEEKKRWSLITPAWPFQFGKKAQKKPASDPFADYGPDQQRALASQLTGQNQPPSPTSVPATAGDRPLPVAPRAYPWPSPVDSHSGSAAFLPPGTGNASDVSLPIPASPPIANQQTLVDHNSQASLADRLRLAYQKQQAAQPQPAVTSSANNTSMGLMDRPLAANPWPAATPSVPSSSPTAATVSYTDNGAPASTEQHSPSASHSPYFDPSQQPNYDRQFLPAASGESSRRSWSDQLQAIAERNATADATLPAATKGTLAQPPPAAPPHASPPPASPAVAPVAPTPTGGGSFPVDAPGFVPDTWPPGPPAPATAPPPYGEPPSSRNGAMAPPISTSPSASGVAHPSMTEQRVVTPPALRLAGNSGVPPAASPAASPSNQPFSAPAASPKTSPPAPTAGQPKVPSAPTLPVASDAGLEAYESAEIESLIRPGRETFDAVPPPEIKTPAGVPSFPLTNNETAPNADDSAANPRGQLDVESQVLAVVGDQSILAADLLWQINLMLAPYVGKATEEQLEEQRQLLMEKMLPKIIENKLVYLDFLRSIPRDQLPNIQTKVLAVFNEKKLPELLEESKVASAADLDAQLRLGVVPSKTTAIVHGRSLGPGDGPAKPTRQRRNIA